MPFTYKVPIPDELTSKSSLRLKEWLLNPGDFVDVGFPLALIDTSDIWSRCMQMGKGCCGRIVWRKARRSLTGVRSARSWRPAHR